MALVDDHELVGVALDAALSGSPTLAYTGQFSNVGEYLEAASETDGASIVVLDLRLADGSSPVQNAETLIATGAAVVVYTAGESPYLIRLAARAPISGLVRKTASIATLVDALERCAAGELSFATDWAAAIASDAGIADAGLSPREQEVLGLMASGMPVKSVAAKLGICCAGDVSPRRRSATPWRRRGVEGSTSRCSTTWVTRVTRVTRVTPVT